MIRYLLDTNVVSEPTRPKPSSKVMALFRAHEAEIAISSTVLHEMAYGVFRMPHGPRRTYRLRFLLMSILREIPILPYDASSAEWHAKERARLEAVGRTPSQHDGMIAAVAATRGLTLVTRNVSDFERFDDLRIENWFA